MPAPTRKRFRFSLIALVVAVNVGGFMCWLNNQIHHPHGFVWTCGWPFAWWYRPDTGDLSQTEWELYGQPYGLAGNILVGIAIAFAAGLLTELVVRRIRKAKRHDG